MIPALQTERLLLRPYYAGMVAQRHVDWLNDKETMKFSEQRHKKHTLESQHIYVNGIWSAPSQFMWGIWRVNIVTMIGTASAYLDGPNSVANIGVLIGEKDQQKSGYGLEAFTCISRWFLEDKQTRKIEAGCMATNIPMIRIALKSGMKPDGYRPDHFLLEDGPVDLNYYARYRDGT